MNVKLTYTPAQLEIFFGAVERFNAIAKGRRVGATRGGAHACIEWCLDGMPVLWGDTIAGNIERYWERYFLPACQKNGIDAHLSGKNVGKIGSGYIDFRSADRPENWEGFGYRKIVLNEAGIILQDPYLYTNAVLPMMMDFPDAQLFALGVPKGKMLKDGAQHPFWRIFQQGIDGVPGHRSLTYETSEENNPYLSEEDIALTIAEISAMSPGQVAQEIGGQFIDAVSGTQWAFAFDEAKHVRPTKFIPGHPVQILADFNVEPFCATLWHITPTKAHCFARVSIMNPSVEEFGNQIRGIIGQTSLLELSGDHNGNNRAIGQNSTASLFSKLSKKLRLGPRQLVLKPNPSHLQSREDTNFVLANHPDFAIDPSCVEVIADLRIVEAGPNGEILKANRQNVKQRADFLDTVRYAVNTYLSTWIKSYSNELSRRGALRRSERVPEHGREHISGIAGRLL